MSAVKGPTQVALVNGWTSAFPCFGVGINRTTSLHRDTQGIRGGLDIIGLLGTFRKGGDMEFPDLNLRLEWTPGCLGAFDGYDFRHKVHHWTGGSRVALISFCRQATWSALGLDSTLARPTTRECEECLLSAQRLRSSSIAGVLAKGFAGQAKTQGEPEAVGNQGNGEACVKRKTAQETVVEQEDRFHMKVEHGDLDLEPCMRNLQETKKRKLADV
jgi:hypothetical protein